MNKKLITYSGGSLLAGAGLVVFASIRNQSVSADVLDVQKVVSVSNFAFIIGAILIGISALLFVLAVSHKGN